MATTSIENGAGFVAADLLQSLGRDLAKELGSGQLAANQHSGAKAATSAANASQSADNAARPVDHPPSGPTPVTDVAAVLLSEVATSDLTKLTRILEPTPDPDSNQFLDSLLRMAVQEVAKGNAERAVGYLADYATRDPLRAEALPFVPALEQVRDKIDSMVNRMTVVAKISAEDGLSRAEQTSTALGGKLSNWDTNADVILKMAHRLFDAGGYANYSRTSELARLVRDAGETKPQALAASASAGVQTNPLMNQMVPGVNVPYLLSPDLPLGRLADDPRAKQPRPASSTAVEDVRRNLRDLKEISVAAVHQLWQRAPLLVMMLTWLAIGLGGGFVFAIASHIWPESLFVAIGNLAFDLWGLGFLALVGFGFFIRIRYRPLH